MQTVSLHYEEFGAPEATPIIILHGFFASSRNWRQVAIRLARNYRVLVLDLRNHGSSPHSKQMDYPSMAADLLHFLERLNLPQAVLLGHSMGGKIAMWFALNYPEKVERLLVIDIAPVSYSHSFDSIIAALKYLPLDEIKNRKEAETMLAAQIPELSFRQFLLQNLILDDGEYRWRIDLDIFNRNAHHIPDFPPVENMSPYFGKSTFIIGGKSQHVKPEYYPAINALFPESKINIMENAGHWLHVEQPQQFSLAISSFLERL